jgi:hypothetical protein
VDASWSQVFGQRIPKTVFQRACLAVCVRQPERRPGGAEEVESATPPWPMLTRQNQSPQSAAGERLRESAENLELKLALRETHCGNR